MAVLGNNIIVFKDGVAIAGTRSNEAQSSADTFETASPDDGKWKAFLPGRKEWNINVGFLVLTEAGVKDLLLIGSVFTLKFQGKDAADTDGVTGTAILTDCHISAQMGSLVTGSFSFKGTGALVNPTTV